MPEIRWTCVLGETVCLGKEGAGRLHRDAGARIVFGGELKRSVKVDEKMVLFPMERAKVVATYLRELDEMHKDSVANSNSI